MLHAFIVNPAAGKTSAVKKTVQTIREACEKQSADYDIALTEAPGDAVRITRHYAESGRDVRVYAVGGDGTLNEVVQAAAGRSHVAVTNLPAGTGNDFLKIFGPACKTAFWDIPALMEGPQAAMDLIDCNGKLGLDIVCAGIDARVARDVHTFPGSGKGAYILSLAKNAVQGLARDMRVTMGGQVWDEPICLVCVCNGRYYGGGFMPVGEAMPDDGILDALLVPKISRLTFARVVGDYAKGRYARHPDLIKPYHGPGPVVLEADEPIAYCIDGEVAQDTRVTIRLAEAKVNFFWPTGLHYRQENPGEEPEVSK